ncbi:SRPBCC family protein, partial [Phytoactinopolyspora endophytica]|uniref:SRPBCC family protein n=1 Tax=Phytoactinopolyspora endophytica TaxID=1642495 RepID=UPI0013E9D48A
MKVTGSAVLHAPRERVWSALNDPAVLVRTIPGCLRLEETAADTYAMTVTAGVGTVKGTYAGQVQLGDQQEPASFVLRASGSGAPGTVSADVRVVLHENGDGVTRLDYDADAIVGGMIGGVGQRMLTGVANKTAGEFFAAVDDVLAGHARASEGAASEPMSGVVPTQRLAAAADHGERADDDRVGVGETGGERRRGRGVYEAPAGTARPAAVRGEFGRGVLIGAS